MSAYQKFDPQAFLKAERQRQEKSSQNVPQTLAALAGLAGPLGKSSKSEATGDGQKPQQTHDVKNQEFKGTPAKAAKPAKVFAYATAWTEFKRACPTYVEPERWQQCLSDARLFFAAWGEQAAALGWTAEELFGLHTPPANPHPSYRRLSRYEFTGLLWGLEGRRVVALTDDTAIVATSSGGTLTYRKYNKPAYGPLGDSLDDFIA